MTKFYDTSSLLLIGEDIFNTSDNIIISSITLKELEHIKTSANKDSHIKYLARQLIKILNKNTDKYTCCIYHTYMENTITNLSFESTNDTRILASAIHYYFDHPKEKFVFITNDLSLKLIAEKTGYFSVNTIEEKKDEYTGYLEIQLNDEEMADFYSNPIIYGQKLKILTNQYLNIYNTNNDRVDTLCWTGENFRSLNYTSFDSQYLGKIKPYKNDIYQAIAADSFINNKITIIKGGAGTGKSTLSLGYLFYLLEKGKIDKIIIFCNPIATKNSARLGLING